MTRFSLGAVVKNKSGPEVTDCFIITWIGIFGPPVRILSDVGGEFVGIEEFNAMCELFGIEHRTTAGYSPFSNGTVERHNGIIGTMVKALMEDLNIKIDVALPWAIQAKNNLKCLQGFTPSQLVFGKNMKVPSISEMEDVTELKEITKSKYLADKINVMQQAREEFLKAERSMKLKRALKSKVENSTCNHYVNGDRVYFKRNLIDKDWHGPGRVVGQLSSVVIILFGGNLIRVHHTKVKMRSEALDEMNRREDDPDFRDVPTIIETEKKSAEKKTAVKIYGEEDAADDRVQDKDHQKRNKDQPVEDSSDSSDEEETDILTRRSTRRTIEEDQQDTEERNVTHETTTQEEELTSTRNEGHDLIMDSEEQERVLTNEPEEEFDNMTECWTTLEKNKQGAYKIKSGDKIKYKIDTQDYEEAIVMSRSGRATSKELKNRYNVMNIADESEKFVNLDKVEDVQIAEPLYVLMECDDNLLYNCTTEERIKDDPGVKEAKMAELENIKKFNAFEEVREHGQKVISSRWVLTQKTKGSKLIHKARLVARGFEETTLIQSDAPTVEKSSIRLFFAVAMAHGWTFQSLDVKAAFLQSNSLDRVVYIKPPRDIRKPGIIWKLLKPLYGINDAGRQWYFTVTEFLVHVMQCKQGLLDKAVYRCYDDAGKLIGIILIHVDDVLYAGTPKFIKTVIKELMKRFEISKTFDGAFMYLGWHLKQESNCTMIDQIAYGKSMKTVEISSERRKQKKELLNDVEIKEYQCLVGQLNWMGCQTRPDLKFDILELSTRMKNPCVENLIQANWVVNKMKDRTVQLKFHRLDFKNIKILMFADASLGNLPDETSSARGHVVLIWCSTMKKVNVISWQCNKVRRVCHATFDSETLSMIEGLEDAIYVRAVLSEIIYNDHRSEVIPIYSYTDSNQLFTSVHSTKPCRNKRLRIDIAEIEEMLRRGTITKLQHVTSSEMIADVLTKKNGQSEELLSVLETGCVNHVYLKL